MPAQERIITGTAFGRPYERREQIPPPIGQDLLAGLLTIAVTVLAAAPVGLLWGHLAPRSGAVLLPRSEAFPDGPGYVAADPSSDVFIAGDGYYLGAVVLAGLVTGLLAWWLGRAHGPAVVVGLTAGGLAAAWVAARVGQQVGAADLARAVAAGEQRAVLTVELASTVAVVGWPLAALLAYLVPSLLRGR